MSAPVVVGVLAVQGDVREHLRSLTEAGAVARAVRRESELFEVDAVVIPGGESTTMSRLMIDFGLLDPLRKLVADGMPVYGSCAGMILLARDVLDGRPDQCGLDAIDMTVRRNAFGRQIDSFETDISIEGIEGGDVHAVFIRAPWVERIGPDVRVLGRVTRGPAAGTIVAVRQRNLLATAFHPELTGDARLHRYFVEMARGASAGRGRHGAGQSAQASAGDSRTREAAEGRACQAIRNGPRPSTKRPSSTPSGANSSPG